MCYSQKFPFSNQHIWVYSLSTFIFFWNDKNLSQNKADEYEVYD